MQTPAILTGNYTRPDDLRPFEYEVILDGAGGGSYAWNARVSSDGLLVGRLEGVLDHLDGMDSSEIELAVRDAVETLIRSGAVPPGNAKAP